MKDTNAEMQVTLKLASYFHTNVRDLSQYALFHCVLHNERLPDAQTPTRKKKPNQSKQPNPEREMQRQPSAVWFVLRRM